MVEMSNGSVASGMLIVPGLLASNVPGGGAASVALDGLNA